MMWHLKLACEQFGVRPQHHHHPKLIDCVCMCVCLSRSLLVITSFQLVVVVNVSQKCDHYSSVGQMLLMKRCWSTEKQQSTCHYHHHHHLYHFQHHCGQYHYCHHPQAVYLKNCWAYCERKEDKPEIALICLQQNDSVYRCALSLGGESIAVHCTTKHPFGESDWLLFDCFYAHAVQRRVWTLKAKQRGFLANYWHTKERKLNKRRRKGKRNYHRRVHLHKISSEVVKWSNNNNN